MSLRQADVRSDLNVSEIPSPDKLATHSLALAAHVGADSQAGQGDQGTGRFVLLNSDVPQDGWGGNFRVICFAKSPLETDIGQDELITDVCWAWLEDALKARGAGYTLQAGTITRIISQGYGSMSTPFSAQSMYNDPGYAFRLNEGIKALDRSAAARGGLLSGAQLKAVNRYGQEYAANEYGNAFNREQLQRASILNPLQSLSGQAQTSANTMSQAAGNLGANQSAALMAGGNAAAAGLIGAGNARASGYVGGANALTGGLGQYMNYTQGQNLLAGLQGGGMGGNAGAATNPYFRPSAGIGSIPSGYYTGE
jgi:hypothetical protein